MTKQSMNFEQWYQILENLADAHGESVADVEAWKESYDAGESPEAAFFNEYPEHEE